MIPDPVFSLRLPESARGAIEELAAEADIAPSTMARRLLLQKLEPVLKRRPGPPSSTPARALRRAG